MPGDVRLMQGNEACVEGALTAGCRFFAGYPITPSTEIAEQMALRLPRLGGRFIQMEDEIASMAAVIGASLTGLKAMTATSGPGFSLKQENLGYACLTEVPVVVINVQRVGPSTGLPTAPAQGDMMQACWGAHGDHPIIAMVPASVQECFTVTLRAFNMSEKYRIPAIVMLDEVVGHMRERVRLPGAGQVEVIDRKRPDAPPGEYRPYEAGEDGVPPMAAYGQGYRFHVTGLFHDENGMPDMSSGTAARLMSRLMRKAELAAPDLAWVEQVMTEDADVLVFSYGSPARVSLRAVRMAREAGVKAGLLRAITVWPFPEELLRSFRGRVKAVIVPEMNMGQMILEVERCLGGSARIVGVNRADGALFKPDEIYGKIREVC